ncbi:ABC transporter substrate-binding protein [Alkalihalobacillus trypoxylicola]|uniref:Iron ABC transporter substrate-binding protein n=1 Tax=Alkalihalobacillus trypoxylicola TaxID=519424 RepID=A0A162ENR5_9BACI|nr:ABC transporter substrate-binding protein [Alkalihalobacillus trypoxylicola]KYG33360.1 iron ABC transporter substrate-binding protein [Alkalihalobacillus trypoxylicola]
MRKQYLAIISFILILILSACGNSEKLTVYVGFQEDHAVEAMKQFTEDTGIEVEMIRMSAGEILAKIRAEKDNPQADVWYGGPADTFVAAVDENLLKPYQSPEADIIDERFKDEEGYWTGIYVGPLGFATNKDFLEKHGLEAPTSWEDLLDPAYENEIIMAHPGSSGTAYAILYTVLKVFGGEEEGFEYLNELHPQVQQYTTSGSAPGRMVGMGEAGAGLLFANDIVKYQEEGFDSIELTIPEDGTGYETGAVAIIEGGPQSELAETFVDWSLGTSAQEVGQRTGSYQNLTNPEAQEPEKAIRLDDINTIDYNPKEAGDERTRLIDKWDQEVNR